MIKINEADFPLKDGGFGRIAIFMYAGDEDPKPILESAIEKYTEGSNRSFVVLVDAHMDCPWVRAIVSDIDEMEQMPFDEYMKIANRDRKIEGLGILENKKSIL